MGVTASPRRAPTQKEGGMSDQEIRDPDDTEGQKRHLGETDEDVDGQKKTRVLGETDEDVEGQKKH
jgi:hypothetical protein